MTTTIQTLPELRALDQAIRILNAARQDLAPGPRAFWRIVDHASSYLEKQLDDFLRLEPAMPPTFTADPSRTASLTAFSAEDA